MRPNRRAGLSAVSGRFRTAWSRSCGLLATPEAGNVFLPAFIEAHNRRFEREPFRDRDAHRPLRERDDLTEILAWKEERTASMNLTLQYDQTLFILEPNEVT